MGGLAFASILTLVAAPVLYRIFIPGRARAEDSGAAASQAAAA
jgi:hypothetical protein